MALSEGGRGRGPWRKGSPTAAVSWFLATGAFTGYLPLAPGTFGTLAAVPLYLLLSGLPGPLAWALAVAAVVAVSVPVAGAAERRVGRKDPGVIVIDEVAGFLVAMLFIAPSWGAVAAGFFLFRAFDVLKPPPGRWAEGLPGGLGIVADDVVAGIYANLALRLLGFLGIALLRA